MSSMLKKGAGAFKPKAPIARRRPAPAAPAPVTATEPQKEPPSVEETAPDTTRDAASSSTAVESRLERHQANPPYRTLRPWSPEARRVATATKGLAVAEPQVSAIPTTVEATRPAPNDASHSEPLAQAAATTTALPGQTEDGSAPTQDPSDAPRPTSAQGDAAAAAARTKTTSRKGGPSALKPARSTPAKKAKSTAELTVPSPAPTPEVASTPSASTSAAPSLDNGEGSSTTSTAKTRKPAARQPRKRKAPTVTAESEADAGTETAGPPKKKRAPRKKKTAANGEESATQARGAGNDEAVVPKKRAPRKKKTTAPAGNDEGGGEANGVTPAETEGEETERTKKARRKRSVTPEDAEQQKVDHEQMVMSELTRDLRIGAKFSKYDELRERIRKKRARQRLIKLGKLQPGEEMPDEHTSESGTPAPDAAKKPAQAPPRLIVEEAPADSVPQLEIVDGHIRINEASMQYDRHAAADQARGVVFEQEEDDFTTPVTQRTYMRRQPQGNFWTDAETIKFYHGLRMFGTDFNMISKMFGGAKNRRQVKLKFNREERANPVAVNRCIIGEKDVPMDLEAVDGADALEDSQAITDELARLKAEQEAETRRQEEEEAATNRRKKDELFGRRKGDKVPPRDHDAHDGGLAGDPFGGAAKHDNHPGGADLNPGAQYGVGTDPDVIDETDLPSATTARGRTRGGGRARKAPQTFAGGIGG
ncbi:hypothetical protein INS49_006749 [Diaporthe citri]|uniref:uncharacterized protein n=1 Tax=Diaporthe citri TaxID=83186 RepID=UPI001C80F8BA|nr:uncharacterized protein INS49_006749 [Diaporthe citri]KAG6365142.1 hypothetical protein INS49_006749 [Diaporthe citri]